MLILWFPTVISDTLDPKPFLESIYGSNFSDKLRMDSETGTRTLLAEISPSLLVFSSVSCSGPPLAGGMAQRESGQGGGAASVLLSFRFI